MATFEAQVEALTGLSISGSSNPTQTELSSFLVDGVIDVVNRIIDLYPEEIPKFTKTTNDTGSVVKVGKILSVVREHDSTAILRRCTPIPPADRYEATNTSSLLYRSKYSPGFYELNGSIYTVPAAGSGNNDIVVTQVHYDTGLVYGDTYNAGAIENFPRDYERLVALYAAIQSLQSKMTSEVITVTVVVPDVPTLSSQSVTITGTAPTYTSPTTTISGTAWATAYPDQYSAITTALTAIATEIGLAKTEAAEIVSQTDNSSDFATALTAMNTELDKADEIIVEANTEIDEAVNLSGAYGGSLTTALTAIKAEIDECLPIADNIHTEVATANAVIADMPTTPTAPTLTSVTFGGVLGDIDASAPTTSTTNVAAASTYTGSAPIFFKPTVQGGSNELTSVTSGTLGSAETDFDQWFHVVGQYIEDQEDTELAGAQLQKITAYINAYGQEMQSAMNKFSEANAAYQSAIQESMQEVQIANAAHQQDAKAALQVAVDNKQRSQQRQLQNSINDMQAIVSDNDDKVSKYQADTAKYNAEVSKAIQQTQGYIGIAQGYANEITAKVTIAQGYASEIQSFSAAGQIFINNSTAFIQEAQTRIAQANGYAQEVTARGGFTSAKSQAVGGYISTAQSYANEVSARLANVAPKVTEYGAKVQDALNAFNDANVEYQAILQKDIQNAQLLDSHEARKLQKYQAEVADYQAAVTAEVQEQTTQMQQYQLLRAQLQEEYRAAFKERVAEGG